MYTGIFLGDPTLFDQMLWLLTRYIWLHLHRARERLLWGAFALSLAGEAMQASAAYFVGQRTARVYVLYVFAEPFPAPPDLRASDVLLKHFFLNDYLVQRKKKRKEKHYWQKNRQNKTSTGCKHICEKKIERGQQDRVEHEHWYQRTQRLKSSIAGVILGKLFYF